MDKKPSDSDTVWRGRPSIGSYLALYGILALIAILLIDGLEFWSAFHVGGLKPIFAVSFRLGGLEIPYGIEVATVVIILLVYIRKVLALVIFRVRNSYELRKDGIYFNRGIANLQNVFVSAMAFSDARLIRTLGMRLVGRSLIIVEANDGRKFEMKMIKDGLNVQSLIRANLSHPTVRVDK